MKRQASDAHNPSSKHRRILENKTYYFVLHHQLLAEFSGPPNQYLIPCRFSSRRRIIELQNEETMSWIEPGISAGALQTIKNYSKDPTDDEINFDFLLRSLDTLTTALKARGDPRLQVGLDAVHYWWQWKWLDNSVYSRTRDLLHDIVGLLLKAVNVLPVDGLVIRARNGGAPAGSQTT